MKLTAEQREDVIKNLMQDGQSVENARIIRDLLWGAFVWSKTPRGHDYWNDVLVALSEVSADDG